MEIIQPADNHIQLWGIWLYGRFGQRKKRRKVPKGFYYIIREWSMAKGIPFASRSELNTFAHFTAKKIAEKGTKLFSEGGRTDILQDPTEKFLDSIEKKDCRQYEKNGGGKVVLKK